MQRRKRSLNRTIKIATRRFFDSWVWAILRIPVFVVIAIFIIAALPILLLCFGVSELINHFRRYCPVHHERFCYEYAHLSSREANENRNRRIEREENIRQASKQGLRVNYRPLNEEYTPRVKGRLFPYSCTARVIKEEAGAYRRRYCSQCRSAEAEWKSQQERRDREYMKRKNRQAEEVEKNLEEWPARSEIPPDT